MTRWPGTMTIYTNEEQSHGPAGLVVPVLLPHLLPSYFVISADPIKPVFLSEFGSLGKLSLLKE